MAEGALDVVSMPAQMKKDRPAHVMKVLAKPEVFVGYIVDT